MCLSIYMGTTKPLEASSDVPEGGITIELASWKPPTLQGYEFVYFVGQVNKTSELGCSCAFVEYVDWQTTPPKILSDDTYKESVECAFLALKKLCDNAIKAGAMCSLVTDDSGGLEQECEKDDYHQLFLRLHSLERFNLIFTGADLYPYRHFTVIS